MCLSHSRGSIGFVTVLQLTPTWRLGSFKCEPLLFPHPFGLLVPFCRQVIDVPAAPGKLMILHSAASRGTRMPRVTRGGKLWAQFVSASQRRCPG